MNKVILLVLSVFVCTNISAQTDSVNTPTVNLKEVVVKAERISRRADGLLIVPSEQLKDASNNGYELLDGLAMPMIRIDKALHSVSSVDNKSVQIRLNGAIANKADLLVIDPKLISSVEYIDNPGLRYGNDIGYVINIKTRRADSGYTVGVDLTNSVSSWQGDDMVFAKWNRRNSQISFSYDFGYNDTRRIRYRENTDYWLSDGSHYYITREDSARRERSFDNSLQLKYILADSSNYVFQASLTTDFSHNPGGLRYQRFMEPDKGNIITMQRNKEKSFSPVLDLYFYHTIGSHQSITANVVGTNIATEEYNFNNEGSDYSYNVCGKTWSITTEAIYENKLKPFTLSVGFNHLWKYTRNKYSGDVATVNNMHNSNLYLFSNIKGNFPKFSDDSKGHYSLGVGMSNAIYRQGSYDYNYWLFRPKATLSYDLSKALTITYDFELSQHISQIAMISNTKIRTNSMEWTVGNPNIKPNRVMKNSILLGLTLPRVYSELYFEYRNNHNCNMAKYERNDDNSFLYYQKNQPHVNMLLLMGYSQIKIIPQKLIATIDGGVYRFFNRGDDYNHCMTSWLLCGSLQAYLGKWTITAQADTGYKFMEGETWNHSNAMSQFQCSYRFGNCEISLIYKNPLESNPRISNAVLDNINLKTYKSLHSKDSNAIILSFSWKFNYGSQYHQTEQKITNHDSQTGIL